MTGRSLHDALLRALASADVRGLLASGEAAGVLGGSEAAVLGAADADRLARLARFMGRHFYRERIVRLFAASRMLARARGTDPLALLASPAFAAILDRAELGSAATAERVGSLVEGALRDVLAPCRMAGTSSPTRARSSGWRPAPGSGATPPGTARPGGRRAPPTPASARSSGT